MVPIITAMVSPMPVIAAERTFCDELDEDLINKEKDILDDQRKDISSMKGMSLLEYVRSNLIGKGALFETPFGLRPMVYADYTASGRSLQCIEDYMQKYVLPWYGNTHTTTSITGLQSTCFRSETRQIIAQCVNAKITGRGAEDVVLFTGSGTTGAINKLVVALGLHVPSNLPLKPVVFVGPFEHHSNLLPWRESAADVVMIPENAHDGHVDMGALAAALVRFADRPLKIGSFSAASNLTGVLTDVDAITCLLHTHGALAFWDYAACAPYVPIDMNNPVRTDLNEQRALAYKDAIFLSGHKFVGGPGSPGVLVVKKRLLGNVVPSCPGGGTIFYVTDEDHRYLSNRVEREEGGTPDTLGSIRLGLAFELKQRILASNVDLLALEHSRWNNVILPMLKAQPNVILLGHHHHHHHDYHNSPPPPLDKHQHEQFPLQDQTLATDRLPILSFLIRCRDRFLHYNFVCALLNDLFGIQSRGGCQCAGPYAQRLLGMTKADQRAIEAALIDKCEVLRPGMSRVSFPFAMSDEEVQFVVKAIVFVAAHGHKFLCQYRFNHKTGEWKHKTRFTKFPTRQWLSKAPFFAIGQGASPPSATYPFFPSSVAISAASIESTFTTVLETAHILAETSGQEGDVGPSKNQAGMLEAGHESLRWFVYPSEVANAITHNDGRLALLELVGPVQPARYTCKFSAPQNAMPRPPPSSVSVSVFQDGNKTDHPRRHTNVIITDLTMTSRAKTEKYPLRKAAFAPAAEAAMKNDQPRGQPTTTTTTTVTFDQYPLHGDEHTVAGMELAHTIATTAKITDQITKAQLFPSPPQKLMRLVGQALMQWNMIKDGDRLLLGVSGGKDSLSLLHVLLTLQKRAPVRFTLACATVDPQTPSFDPSPLKGYMDALGIEYHYLSENIIERASCEMDGDSLCSYCSRMKRGLLYTCCRTHDFNKLVLAQHLDDLAESFIMSAMYNGQIRTMKAKYWNDTKDVEILRPLVYVREGMLKHFAYEARLPVINENCPACFEEPKERARVKKMLFKEENLNPEMYNSFRRALLPLMDNECYQHLNAIRKRIDLQKNIKSNTVQSTKKQQMRTHTNLSSDSILIQDES